MIDFTFNLFQPAEKWVSKVVLAGCVLITVGLVYVSYQAEAIGQEWAKKPIEQGSY